MFYDENPVLKESLSPNVKTDSRLKTSIENIKITDKNRKSSTASLKVDVENYKPSYHNPYNLKSRKAPNQRGKTEISINHCEENDHSKIESGERILSDSSVYINYRTHQ